MIQILLATYNSGAFLEQQLASLMEQSCQDFQILVSDGGSRDDTLEIIGSWQKRFPEKIRLLHSSPAAACENFSRLLAAADAELIMPVWPSAASWPPCITALRPARPFA